MASFIVTTSKAIDSYLDALPEIENKEEEQLQRIEELQAENKRYETEILELIAIAGTPCPPTNSFLLYSLVPNDLSLYRSQSRRCPIIT